MNSRKKTKDQTDLVQTGSQYFVVTQKEIANTKFALEKAMRAWQEEHNARMEAEKAYAEVIDSTEDSMDEVAELKMKLTRELEEARLRTREAVQARALYEEAKARAEEVKKIWKEACRARISRRPHNAPAIEAPKTEERSEFNLKWME